jgi:ubiquitin carboxyl-terminal hydrolase 36/42
MAETVVFKCEGCEEEVSMEKQLLLDQTPSSAAFHLKRFKTTIGNLVEKIDKHINFPLELDMQPYTILNEDEDNNVCFFIYLFTYISLVNSLY